jgi:hypothetical protein
MLADNSLLHSREEFFDLVAKHKIVSSRIPFPVLKGFSGFNRKKLMEYINDPELDPADLNPKKRRDNLYYDEDDIYEGDDKLKSDFDRLLDSDLKDLIGSEEELAPMEITILDKKYLKRKDDIDKNYLFGKKKKKKSKGKKSDALIRSIVSDMRTAVRKYSKLDGESEELYRYGLLVDDDLSERKDIYEENRFTGSLQTDHHVELYMLAMGEEELRQPSPFDPHLTVGNVMLNNFYRKLENSGIQTIELRRMLGTNDEKYIKKNRKKADRANKKMEREIIDRIKKLKGDPKFKKLISKSEKELNSLRKEREEED